MSLAAHALQRLSLNSQYRPGNPIHGGKTSFDGELNSLRRKNSTLRYKIFNFTKQKTNCMIKHLSFFFTSLTLIFAGNSTFGQFNQAQLAGEWQRAKAYTKEYMDAMSPDGYGL